MGDAVADGRGLHDRGHVVSIMEARLKIPIVKRQVESLRAMVEHHKGLERGDSPLAQRELARLEGELRELDKQNEQPSA
jgi:hypothetical protein